MRIIQGYKIDKKGNLIPPGQGLSPQKLRKTRKARKPRKTTKRRTA